MDKLLNLLNELAEKYSFEEEDIKRIQKAVFDLETGDSTLDGDMAAEDFVAPEEDEYNDRESE